MRSRRVRYDLVLISFFISVGRTAERSLKQPDVRSTSPAEERLRRPANQKSPITIHVLSYQPGVTINPRLMAMAIASVRPMASNLAKIDLTWALTVFSLIYNTCPISLLLRPFAIY